MFSVFAKIIQRIAHYPKSVIALFSILALLSIYPIENLRWEIQLQDTLNGKEIQADYSAIEKSFGGLGSLTLVIQSDDSLKNYRFAEDLTKTFEKDPAVHYIEYTADVEFFRKNRLLYASEDDLDHVLSAIDSIKNAHVIKSNPFIVDLQESESAGDSTEKPTGIVKEIEQKYFNNLQQSFSNAKGTIRVIDIYPSHSLSDLQANRHLYNHVKEFAEEKGSGIRVLYTGKVFKSIQTGRMLLPEAKFAGKMAALFIFVLLVINFYRQPQLIVVSAIPIAFPTVFTLALAYLLFGRINLFTLSLGLLLPGHASQIISHVYTRYFHERQQKLSPALCIESALLGIGPVVAASSLVIAFLFVAFMLIPLPGLREFGVLGAAGTLMNLAVCPLITTSLLLMAQRKKPFDIRFTPKPHKRLHRLFPNKVNWIIIVSISIVSSIGWIYSGANLTFLYDFKKTELQLNEKEVQALIDETGFSSYDPVIVMLPDSSYNDDLVRDFEREKELGNLPDLARLYTQYQFQPKISQNKRRQIETLKSSLTEDLLATLSKADSASIVEMLENYESDIREFELSESISRKFSDKKGNSGVFAFIIPATNPDNGLTCRHIASQLKRIDGIHNKKFKAWGTPILRASILDTILGNVDKSIALGTILLCLVLLLFYNKLSRAFFTLLPSLFAMSWVTILVHQFNIQISAYSSIAFVLLIGASVDGSLQLWSSYYEKQNGTAWTVLQQKYLPVLVAQGASFIGALAMLFSSHPGIHSLGIIVLIGLSCIFVSQFTIYPLIASTLDAYRIYKKAKARHEKFIH